MRIISQDGAIDVPYETSILHIATSTKAEYSKSFIFYTPNNSMDSNELARYSTEAKAQKAMEMLRKEYGKHFFGQGWAMATANFYVPPFAFIPPKVFQFPQDEDVEV